jgi:hypothetical protein
MRFSGRAILIEYYFGFLSHEPTESMLRVVLLGQLGMPPSFKLVVDVNSRVIGSCHGSRKH